MKNGLTTNTLGRKGQGNQGGFRLVGRVCSRREAGEEKRQTERTTCQVPAESVDRNLSMPRIAEYFGNPYPRWVRGIKMKRHDDAFVHVHEVDFAAEKRFMAGILVNFGEVTA